MGFLGFLDDQTRITGQERERCVAYLQEELRLAQFEEVEADRHNNTGVKYSACLESDQRAARECWQSANRLAEAAKAILEHRRSMGGIPDAGQETFFAWQDTFSKFSAWASGLAVALEASASGMTPNVFYVQKVLNESEQAKQKALKAEQKFVRRLGLTGNEFKNMTDEAVRYVSANPWEPGQKLWTTSGVSERPEAGIGYCTKCGQKNVSQANYCPDCGMPLAPTPAAQPKQEVADGPLTMTVTMHGNAVESPQQVKPNQTEVESPPEAKPELAIDEICQDFYDRHIFHAVVMDIDAWSHYLDIVVKNASEADPSFAKVDRSQFQSEMSAIRMELFLLALSRTLKDDGPTIAARKFTKRYLEEIGRPDIWELIKTYNQMLAESSIRGANEKRLDGRMGRARILSLNQSRLDKAEAWMKVNVENPNQMTDDEKERLECATPVWNHIGVDIRKNDYVAVKFLSYRLAVHLGLDQKPKLKHRALQVLQAAIYGYYLGAEEYLSNPEKYGQTLPA